LLSATDVDVPAIADDAIECCAETSVDPLRALLSPTEAAVPDDPPRESAAEARRLTDTAFESAILAFPVTAVAFESAMDTLSVTVSALDCALEILVDRRKVLIGYAD